MKKVTILKKTLRDLYLNQGLTTYQVAEKLGFCQGTIWNRLVEYGIKRRLPYTLVGFSKQQLKKWYLGQKLSTWEIQKLFGHSRGTVHRKLKELGLGTRNIAKSHIRFPRKDFNGDITEKAYLIGFRLGDLNVTKRGIKSETIVVKCASTKSAQLELIKNLFSKYGHILEGKPTREAKINIQANLNDSFSFLLNKNPRAYEWVFKNRDTFFAFLGGFSDAEGSFFVGKNNQACFALGNYDFKLLLKLKKFLQIFGIDTPTLGVHLRKGKMSKDGYVSKGDYFTLHCSRKKYLLKLLDSLRPFLKHSDKKASLIRLENNISSRNRKFGFINMYQ